MSKLWVWVKGLGIFITGTIAFSGNSAIANINQDANFSESLGISTQENTRMFAGGNQSGSNQSRSCKQRSVSTLDIANFQNAANLHHKNSRVTNSISSRLGLGHDTLKLQQSLDQTDNQVNTTVKKQEFQQLTSTIANTNTVQNTCLICGIDDEGIYICIEYPNC